MKIKRSIERVKPVIYVGTDVGNVLKQYAVYANGIPKEVPEIGKLLKDCEELEKLFLPVHQLNDWEKKVQQKGSLEWILLDRVRKFVGK